MLTSQDAATASSIINSSIVDSEVSSSQTSTNAVLSVTKLSNGTGLPSGSCQTERARSRRQSRCPQDQGESNEGVHYSDCIKFKRQKLLGINLLDA